MARFLGGSTVRFDAWIKQRTAEYRISNRRITKDGIASLSLFIKLLEYLPSTFDIHDSIFYIRFFKVSFSIKLAVFLASGAARMKLHGIKCHFREVPHAVTEYRLRRRPRPL